MCGKLQKYQPASQAEPGRLIAASMFKATITGCVYVHIGPGHGKIETRLRRRGFCVLVLPLEAFEVTVQTPDVVRMLRGPAQRVIQPQVSPIDLLRFCHPTLFQHQRAKGVSGYVYHSVPVAIHAWLVHQRDYRSAVTSVIQCGGDTDSIGAIVGGIVGAAVGKDGIPFEWLNNILEWPRSVAWMERLGTQLDFSTRSNAQDRPATLPVWAVLPRNLFFLLVVLYHGFRRLFPPY